MALNEKIDMYINRRSEISKTKIKTFTNYHKVVLRRIPIEKVEIYCGRIYQSNLRPIKNFVSALVGLYKMDYIYEENGLFKLTEKGKKKYEEIKLNKVTRSRKKWKQYY